jgi:hypothetical protein
MLARLKSLGDWLIELGTDVLLEGFFEAVFNILGGILKVSLKHYFTGPSHVLMILGVLSIGYSFWLISQQLQ